MSRSSILCKEADAVKEQNEIAVVQPPKKRRASTPKQPAPPKLKLLFTVVNREKADLYVDLLQGFDSTLQLIASANGTANIEMLR